MFKKIHSNRDPRDTLYSELKKEFSVYVEKGNDAFQSMIRGYPRFFFALMIALLTASLTLAVVLHHKLVPPDKISKVPKVQSAPVSAGLDNILAAGNALKQSIRLRSQVDSITAKRILTKTDSLALLQDLDSLQHIRIHLPN
jgi:hypothetical protein